MINEQEHAERMALYEQGLSDREIGQALHLAGPTVHSWRVKNNLPNHRTTQLDRLHNTYMQLYIEGKSDGEIAAITGTGKTTVLSWRRREALPSKRRFNGGNLRCPHCGKLLREEAER